MKRRQLEGQSSITSFFGAPAAKRQQTGDTQSDPAAQHQATPLEEESEVAVEPVAAVSSAACADLPVPYFSDIGECWKGFTDGGMPMWEPVPRTLSDAEKLGVVSRHFMPDKGFEFPVRVQADGKQRKFQLAWLDEFPWLVYSKTCNAGFCLPCLLFAPDNPKLGQLYRSPLENFTCFKTACSRHDTQDVHAASAVKLANFKLAAQGDGTDIAQQLVDASGKQTEENMEKLRGIVETILLCGRQNLPLRGHRNEQFRPGRNEKRTGNPGNFLALLEFRSGAGDKSVGRDFHRTTGRGSGGRRAQYMSPMIQNDLIKCCGDNVREQILDDVKKSPFFTVLADEATDASNKEQMSIVLRYLNVATNEIRESFLAFVSCDDGTTGAALAEQILAHLTSWGLDMSKLRGQGYDGAANMSGEMRGCAARITDMYPKALYIHCCSHALNLCVMGASKCKLVLNLWTALREVAYFFNASPKRQQKLMDVIKATADNEEKATKLTDLCRTRWAARHTALVTFDKLYDPVVQCLEDISTAHRMEWNVNTSSQASSFLKLVVGFDFIASFVVVSEVMSVIQSLTTSLQEASLDIVRAYCSINAVHDQIKKIRQTVDSEHQKWWVKVEKMAASVSTNASMPRTCARQSHRANTPAVTPCEYYKKSLSIPILDELSGHMDSKFSKHQQVAAMGLSLLPQAIQNSPDTSKATAMSFAKEYQDDLPPGQSLTTFSAELDRWIDRATATPAESLPTTITESIRLANTTLSPCIHQLLCVVAVLPATTCSCERSISSLRRLKTYLRSTMVNSRLCGLALLHVHYTCEVDVNQVITKFLLMAPRSIIAPVSAISGPIQEDMEPQPDNDSDDEQYYADE